MDLKTLIHGGRTVLTEGSVIERLRRGDGPALDPDLLNGPLIYDPAGRRALAGLWTEYLTVAYHHQRPMLLAAPTWRLNRDRGAASTWAEREINADAVAFCQAYRQGYRANRPDHTTPIMVGGQMACQGDAYRPEEGLETDAAEEFHTWQAEKLAAAGPDYISVGTLPNLDEALGLARALSRAAAGVGGIDFLIGFVIRPNGELPDGTPLTTAMDALDSDLADNGLTPPLGYMATCVYPAAVTTALDRLGPVPRLIGLQANASDLSPEELEAATEMKSRTPEQWVRDFSALIARQPLPIVGGCCGTGAAHLALLAQALNRRTGRG